MENQRKLQLQKLFQITPSSSTNFPGLFCQFIAIFMELSSFRNVVNRKRIWPLCPTCLPPHFRLGPSVGGHLAHRHHVPTKLPVSCVFKDVVVPTGPVRCHRLVFTISAATPLSVGRRCCSSSHRSFALRRSTSPHHPVVAQLPHQCRRWDTTELALLPCLGRRPCPPRSHRLLWAWPISEDLAPRRRILPRRRPPHAPLTSI
jgi:hypothetical protein